MAEKTKQAEFNPTIRVEDGMVWIGVEQGDIQVTRVAKDGKPTGERKLKFAKSYTQTELNQGKSFSVVGENGKVEDNNLGGIYKSLSFTGAMVNPKAQDAKSKANMLLNFNKILRERSLLKTEKSVKGEIVPIVIKDTDVITLVMLDKWEKDENAILIGHTFQAMLKADATHSNESKRGSWFKAYLKIKAELGQSTALNHLDALMELASTGASAEKIVEAAQKAKAEMIEQQQRQKAGARLVKSQANAAKQADVASVEAAEEVEAQEVSEPEGELTEQGID